MRGAGDRTHKTYKTYLNGRDLRTLPYSERKAQLQQLLRKNRAMAYVDDYASSKLFEVVERLDLEGVVAKRVRDPYDTSVRWIKVRHTAYSQTEGRWELFGSPKK